MILYVVVGLICAMSLIYLVIRDMNDKDPPTRYP